MAVRSSFPQYPKTVILIVKSCFDSPRLVAFSLVAVLAALLAGCGQRGPLYLPSKPDAIKAGPQSVPAPAKAPADSQVPASN